MSERKLLQMGLSLLEAIGLNPMTQNGFGKVKLCVGSFLLISHFVLLLIEFGSKWNEVETSQVTGEFVVSEYQCVAKLLAAIINRDKCKQLIVKINRFKNIEALDRSLQAELVAIYKKMEIVLKLYMLTCLLCVLVVFLRPILLNLHVFPVPLYNFIDLTKSPQYQVFYAFEIVEYVFMSFLVLGTDVLFFSFVIYIYCELKIVMNEFEFVVVDDERLSNYDQLSAIMRHHDFVLGCFKNLNFIYSILFLNQVLSSMFAIFMSILVLISTGTMSIGFVLQHVLYFAAVLSQLFFYCLAGAQITEQSQKVPNVIFHTSWWLEASIEVKRNVIMAIRRAQKNESITAGGMFNMDLKLCSSVLKTSLSFLNAVLALKK